MNPNNSKYNRIIIFSGGGTRFGMYCGMYAALEDLNLKPDLIIATCGGSIATAIINAFETNTEQKNYLQSEELYHYVRSTKLTAERKLYRIGWISLLKTMNKKRAPIIEDVFTKYIVEMPQDLANYLPSLSRPMAHHVKSIIIGSKILFDPKEVNKKRKNRMLYQKTVFTDKETAAVISSKKISQHPKAYQQSAVDNNHEIITDIPMLRALRISVSDMYYVEPASYDGQYFAGGAIDLVPLELAQAFGDHVIVEKKKAYTKIEEALIRAVLGFSGNERLAEIEELNQDSTVWIDTTDATEVLRGHYCRKKINWKKLEVEIDLPQNYKKFKSDMEIQWQYGYNKIIKMFGS